MARCIKLFSRTNRWKKRQRQDKLTEQNRINSAFSLFIFKVKKNYLLLIWLTGLGNPISKNNGKVLDWKGESRIKRDFFFFYIRMLFFSGQAETVADSEEGPRGPPPPPLIFGPNGGPKGWKKFFSQTAHPPPPLRYSWIVIEKERIYNILFVVFSFFLLYAIDMYFMYSSSDGHCH